MRKFDLLESFPKPKRIVGPGWRTEENKVIAKRYGREFFDGERVNGYGGYYYDGRWKAIARKLGMVYGVNHTSAVLDIGCAKGFLLHDLRTEFQGIGVAGIDISKYALSHAMDGFSNYLVKNGARKKTAEESEKRARESLLPHLIEGSADNLPWMDNSFDVVLAINTIHNLPREKCKKAIHEMMRVCRNKKNMFIQVDGYSDETEKERMKQWVLTAETMMHVDEWLKFYGEAGYEGDYFWTTV